MIMTNIIPFCLFKGMEVADKTKILNCIMYWIFPPNILWPETKAKMSFLLLLERTQSSVNVGFTGITQGAACQRENEEWRSEDCGSQIRISECTKDSSSQREKYPGL